jgi:stage II sporulation protein AA (anti-sigma F factor antagonist)
MPEPPFRYLRASTQQGVLVLTVTHAQLRSGDFELVDALRQEMLDAAADANARKVVVDLSGVDYVGSAGFRPLLSLRKRLQEAGGEMLLCGLVPDVHEVFLTSRLINAAGTWDAPFGVEPDLARAVARLNRTTNNRQD